MTIPWLKIILGMGGVTMGAVAALHSCHPDPAIKAGQDGAKTAAAQDQVDQATPAIAEQSATKTLHIEVTAKEVEHAIQAAPGADTTLPPDVLNRWRDGVGRVRATSLAAHAGATAGAGPSGLPTAVPTP